MSIAIPLDVRSVHPPSGTDWDAAVSRFPGSNFFHTSTWARILSDTYGFRPLYLKVGEEQRTALLPLMEVNSCVTGRRGVALPFTDECDALCSDQECFDSVLRAAQEKLFVRGWRYVELRGCGENLGPFVHSAGFFGHSISFEKRSPEQFFGALSNSTRGAIKKAEKNGLIVEAARSIEDMNAFYALVCQTRYRHGNPPQPIKFFHELHRHAIAGGFGLLLLARHQGRAVAGAIFLHSGRSAIYKYAASDSAFRHLSANNLVLWRGLEWYIGKGYVRIQLGRTSLENEGLRRFKLGWASKEYSIKYFRYAKKTREFVTGADNSTGWQTRIFKLLPQPLSRHIGAIAYRHIA